MKKDGFTRELRGTLFGSLTGRAGDVSGQRDGDVRGMLMSIAGPGKTKSGINLTAAAKELGVTRRTVERWVTDAAEKGRPRGKNLDTLVSKSRQAATTKAGRRKALKDTKQGPMGRYGAKLSVKGPQGPKRAGKDYKRNRRVQFDVAPEDVQAMIQTYEDGGDQALVSWLEGYADQNYVDGWGFDGIEEFDLGDPREGL